jgi:large-conductance mechanosensitive channel
MNVANQFSNPSKFKEELINFLVENKVIGTVAGVGIALASKDLIQSMVGDVVFPSIYYLLLKMHGKYFTKILPDNTKFDMPNFVKHLISWVFIIIITYFFVTVVFKMLLGVNASPANKEDKKEGNDENVQDVAKEGFLGFLSCLAGRQYDKTKVKTWDFGIFKYEKNKRKKCNEGFTAFSPAVLTSSAETIIQPLDPNEFQAHEDILHGSPLMTLEERARRRLQNL